MLHLQMIGTCKIILQEAMNLLLKIFQAKRKSVTLNYIIKYQGMLIKQKREDLSMKIKDALDRGIKKLLAETKATNSYLVVSDKNGKIKKIAAKDL